MRRRRGPIKGFPQRIRGGLPPPPVLHMCKSGMNVSSHDLLLLLLLYCKHPSPHDHIIYLHCVCANSLDKMESRMNERVCLAGLCVYTK